MKYVWRISWYMLACSWTNGLDGCIYRNMCFYMIGLQNTLLLPMTL